jgi:hypothetical protein
MLASNGINLTKLLRVALEGNFKKCRKNLYDLGPLLYSARAKTLLSMDHDGFNFFTFLN